MLILVNFCSKEQINALRMHQAQRQGSEAETDAQASAEEIKQQKKDEHRQEVKEFKKWFKYSPFYLKSHPDQREQGDIADIQQMSQTHIVGGDDLAGVEAVFEKHFSQFDKLMSKSDASKQLQDVKDRVKKV